MKTELQYNSPRRVLLDMAKGTHSGYWVEVLRPRSGDGQTAYMLHTPVEQRNGCTWRNAPCLPRTWEAVQMHFNWATNDDNADAAALPKYDENRTYTGDVAGIETMRALCKWAVR